MNVKQKRYSQWTNSQLMIERNKDKVQEYCDETHTLTLLEKYVNNLPLVNLSYQGADHCILDLI